MNPLAPHQRKAPHEGIDRERRVNVQIAEKDSVRVGRRTFLPGRPRSYVVGGERDARNLTVVLLVGAPVHEPKSQDQQHQAENDRKTALFPPSHAGGSIGPDMGLSKQSWAAAFS